MAFLVSSFLLVTLLGSANFNNRIDTALANFETTEVQMTLRRRLQNKREQDTEPESDSESQSLRYLSFGGPLTFGRGLDRVKRTSEAYPYLLSSSTISSQPLLSSSSSSSSKKKRVSRVRNVAHSTYDVMGPAMVSLCTQSIVEGPFTSAGTRNNANAKPYGSGELYSSLSSSSSTVEYDVITLEYSFASTNIAAPTTQEAFLSTIRLLVKRLQQRYPLARIVLVQLWTPSDLVYFDVASNRTVSFEEWRGRQPSLPFPGATIKKHDWIFRELSQTEREVEENLESTMDSVGGLVYKLPRPQSKSHDNDNVYDHSISPGIPDDWFLEENDTDGNGDAWSSSYLRYTYMLSRDGHAAVAEGIRAILKDASVGQNRNHNRLIPSSSSTQLLYSWGSGDSCQLWFDSGANTNTEMETLPMSVSMSMSTPTPTPLQIPDPNDYSSGLRFEELVPGTGLYALEVESSKGTAALKVHNPFDTDRVVYLTYLTTSETAASNKVYPKTRVRMTVEEEIADAKPRQDLSQESPAINALHQIFSGRSPTTKQKPAIPHPGSGIILDPSHGFGVDGGGDTAFRLQHEHRTRTSAVGVVPALRTGILEFAALEEYTVHNFRIVGVSILPELQDTLADKDGSSEGGAHVPFEFSMVSPRRLSISGGAGADDDDDDNEISLTEETKP